jgi:hypothetical protein
MFDGIPGLHRIYLILILKNVNVGKKSPAAQKCPQKFHMEEKIIGTRYCDSFSNDRAEHGFNWRRTRRDAHFIPYDEI